MGRSHGGQMRLLLLRVALMVGLLAPTAAQARFMGVYDYPFVSPLAATVAEMRAAMLVKPGDKVTAEVVNGEFRIVSPRVAIRRLQAATREWRENNPDVDPVAELIADRREEARREAEEADAWRTAHGLPPF